MAPSCFRSRQISLWPTSDNGVKARDGYGSERFRVEPAFAIKSTQASAPGCSARACQRRRGRRATMRSGLAGDRRRGRLDRTRDRGGPIGLLAVLMGVQRGFDVHVFDRITDGPRPELVHALGATYHSGDYGVVLARLLAHRDRGHEGPRQSVSTGYGSAHHPDPVHRLSPTTVTGSLLRADGSLSLGESGPAVPAIRWSGTHAAK